MVGIGGHRACDQCDLGVQGLLVTLERQQIICHPVSGARPRREARDGRPVGHAREVLPSMATISSSRKAVTHFVKHAANSSLGRAFITS